MKQRQKHSALVGSVFGKWTVVAFHESNGRYRICRCSCGRTEKAVKAAALENGTNSRCMLCSNELRMVTQLKARGRNMVTWRSWNHAEQRCHNPNNLSYQRYGGRGIKMCERWREAFENFLEDMGPRPSGTSLDRIDNNGDYEPGNCRWATPEEQNNNKRTNRLITLNGVQDTVTRWARKYGIHKDTIFGRLFRGWDAQTAITTPIQR